MIPATLPQQPGQPLDPAKVTASIRKLFASGLYRDIHVLGRHEGDGVVITYVGTPRYFVGRVQIVGVKEERLSALLEYATKLPARNRVYPGDDRRRHRRCARIAGQQRVLSADGSPHIDD